MIGESFLGLVHNVSLLLAMVLVFDVVSRRWRTGRIWWQDVIVGAVVGGVGVAIMLTPWVFIPGVVFDTRSVLLGISGLFFGTLPTIVAMAITIALRIYQGGTGAVMGVSVILATGTIGILWRKFSHKPMTEINWKELYVFGVIIHIIMILLAFTMPLDVALKTVQNIIFPVLAIYPVGTVLLGNIIIARLNRDQLTRKVTESEARYKIVADNTYDWEYWKDENNQFIYCSPSCLEISGYSQEDYFNNPNLILKIIHPDDIEIYKKHQEMMRIKQTAGQIDFRIIRPDGTIRWIGHACRPVYNNFGKFIGTRGSNRDITDKKNADTALQANEEKYRSFTEKISDVIWVLDSDTLYFTYVSPSIEKLQGYVVSEIISKSINFVIRPEDVLPLQNLIISRRDAYKNGTAEPDRVYINEIEQPRKDGTSVFVEIKTSFQTNPETGHIEILGISRDISERKKMEIALQKEISLIDAIFNSVPGVLYLYDSDGYLLRWNKKHEDMTGYSAAELDHFYLLDWYKGEPDDLDRVTKGVEKALKEGFAMAEANLTTKSGEKILFEFTAARLDIGGKTYFTGIGIDIRDRRAAENKIREQTVDLEKKKEEAEQYGRVLLSMLEDQKRVEEALEREQYLMRTLMDTVPDNIWFKDTMGRFLRANKAQAHRLGLSEPSELQGKTDFDFFSNEHAQQAFDQELSIINGGPAIVNNDELLTYPDRTPEWVSVTKLPLFDENGNIIGTYGLARDITERKMAEKDLQNAYEATLEGWAAALELREKETATHSRNVVDMTMKLAAEYGFSDDEMIHIRRGALLHDIGKMGIPDSILLKPGPLTDDEWTIMRMHPTFAMKLLSHISYLTPSLDIPYRHHERWNGAGYPSGLKGEDIPLPARIFAVVDVWDALSSDRPYRPAWPKDAVENYLKEQSGVQFDPGVVDTFLRLFSRDLSSKEG
jgi:PAS domain S-box-containing protein